MIETNELNSSLNLTPEENYKQGILLLNKGLLTVV